MKIADVKQKVAAEKGFEAAQMRLIWSGKLHDSTPSSTTIMS